VCIDVLYGDVLSRRRFVEETFCMCALKGAMHDNYFMAQKNGQVPAPEISLILK
jgi:hypothetical protein